MRAWRWTGLCVLLCVAVSGCTGGEGGGGSSDGGGTFEGCGSDADCKGDRICEDSVCVNPGSGGGDGDSPGDGDGDRPGDGDGDRPAGDGDGDSSGDGDRQAPLDDPALEAACMSDCQAKWDADCPAGFPSLDQCNGQCLIIDEINGGYCHDEQRAQYNCLAGGGYSCGVNDYAQPNSTCVVESQALQVCNQQVPCWTLCDQGEYGCSADRDSCVQKCDEDFAQFEDFLCANYYNQLLTCWGQQETLDCQGGKPSLAGCGPQVAEIGDCLDRYGETCDGFCWAAEQLGCGTGCQASCTDNDEDVSCSYEWGRIIDCALGNRELYMRCDGDVAVPTGECASEVQNYDDCVLSNP